MSKKEADILQIKKYRNGQLNAKAMHDLERRALEDPFLMDALEGFEKNAGDQQAGFDELSARLQQRVSKKERRVIPWRIVSIAASVLIAFSAGILWLNDNRDVYKTKSEVIVKPLAAVTPQAAETVKPAPENKIKTVAPADKTVVATLKKMAVVTGAHANKPVVVYKTEQPVLKNADAKILAANSNIKDSVAKDTTPLNEMVVMGYTQKKKETSNAVTVINLGKLKKVKDTIPEQLLEGQAAGVANNNTPAESRSADVVVEGKTIPAKTLREISIINKSYAVSTNVIKGKVIANKDGSPISGATVKVAGTNIGAITDVNGRFALPADSSKSKLVVTNAGLSAAVKQYSRDSLKVSPVPSAAGSLNEVAVTGNTPKKGTGAFIAVKAHPQPGWEGLRKYLKKNATSPDRKTGTVRLSFSVNKSGLITGIKIENGLSRAANKRAIDLINNGPAWVGNTNGQPETINLKIKFDK